MNKCAHITLHYQAVVSGNAYWQCLECGQRFQVSPIGIDLEHLSKALRDLDAGFTQWNEEKLLLVAAAREYLKEKSTGKHDFIDACAAQQEGIQAQVDEYKQARESAFPYVQMSEVTGQPINGCFSPGITIRDYFAAAALTGYCANPSTCHKGVGHEEADYCYKIADQMIHEKVKGQ